MKREAFIARTPYGSSNVNHLRLSSFRILNLILDNGSKTSKCYFLQGRAIPPGVENRGGDDFHFAPGHQLSPARWDTDASKADPVKIKYILSNPATSITEGILEIYTRYDETPVWTRALKGAELKDGEHTLKFAESEDWDGRIENADKHKFPDGYVTAEYSAYKLKLTLKGEGGSEASVAWTYFHILIGKLEIEYGDKKMLPLPVVDKPDHRQVLAMLEAQSAWPPAQGSKVKVLLESNIYRRPLPRAPDGSYRDEMFNNALYEKYKAMWGNGAKIPLIVTAWIKDSNDKNVLAPLALGKLKFLWDWESRSAVSGNTFVDQATDYDKDSTKPKGLNCHNDRGGKRENDNEAVFPVQSGYAPEKQIKDGPFPFKVEACPEPRKWSAISYAWREKVLAAKTGVIFQPGRMAGDAYSVSVYVAYDVSSDKKIVINTDADAPLPIHASLKLSTGDFEVWRKTHLRQYLKKRDDVTTLNIADIISNYKKSFMEIEDVSGGPVSMTEVDWNNAIRDAVSAWSDEEKLLIDPLLNQYHEGTVGVGFRSHDQFVKASYYQGIEKLLLARRVDALSAEIIAGAGSHPLDTATGVLDAVAKGVATGYSTAVWQANIEEDVTVVRDEVNAWISGKRLITEKKHAEYAGKKGIKILEKIFDSQFNNNDDGIRIFQVTQSTNVIRHQLKKLIGLALIFDSTSVNQCGFLLMSPDNAVACGNEKISAHEIGHHFFLPHPFGTTPDEPDYFAHDANIDSCLMSYNYHTAMELCGLCQLRLRGWTKMKLNSPLINELNPDGKKNKKI